VLSGTLVRLCGEEVEGPRPSGRSGRDGNVGQAQVSQDLLDCRWLLDHGDDLHATAAPAAREDVDLEDVPKERCPIDARGAVTGRGAVSGRIRWWRCRRLGHASPRHLLSGRHHLRAELRVRGEQSVEANQMDPRRRHQDGEL
jgi:hypothetical protein